MSAASTVSWVLPPLNLRWLLHVLEEGAAAALEFPFQERLSTLILLGQFPETVAHALQSHAVVVEIEAQWGRCRRLADAVDQAVEGSLDLGGIILRNLGIHS